MHRTPLLLVAALALASSPALGAQTAPPRERVHPELVDTTWGTRTHAAWEQAWASHWSTARDMFAALHREQPDALEPRLGLAFVARATSRYDEARRWYSEAVALEPASADIRAQRDAAEWDRPWLLDLSAGSTNANGAQTSDWSAGVVAAVAPQVLLTGRAGALGGGDPIHGIFLDSASGGGVRATVVSGGIVVRPTDRLTASARYDHWHSGSTSDDFLYLDGAVRLTTMFSVHATARPMSGTTGAPQLGGAIDVTPATGNTFTTELVQGLRAAPFEARTQVREFYQYTPNVRWTARLGAVRDVDPRLSATTFAASATRYFTPYVGARLDATTRSGAFARNSIGLAVVLRR